MWERAPVRVTFQPDDTQKVMFTIRDELWM